MLYLYIQCVCVYIYIYVCFVFSWFLDLQECTLCITVDKHIMYDAILNTYMYMITLSIYIYIHMYKYIYTHVLVGKHRETATRINSLPGRGNCSLRNIQKYDRLRQVQQKEGSASALVKMIAGASDELELLVERPTMKAGHFCLDQVTKLDKMSTGRLLLRLDVFVLKV